MHGGKYGGRTYVHGKNGGRTHVPCKYGGHKNMLGECLEAAQCTHNHGKYGVCMYRTYGGCTYIRMCKEGI
jgi:hypothetical protein